MKWLFTAADSQESGSPPPSPADSTASDAAPTLVHIKQETMPPGGDLKEYYAALEFGLPEYLPSSYPDRTCSQLQDYPHHPYLPRSLDLQNQRFLDTPKSPFKDNNDQRNSSDEEYKDGVEDSNERQTGCEVNLPSELIYKRGGVYARVGIPNGTRYGPFIGKWEQQPLDRRYAWEVSGHLFIIKV